MTAELKVSENGQLISSEINMDMVVACTTLAQSLMATVDSNEVLREMFDRMDSRGFERGTLTRKITLEW